MQIRNFVIIAHIDHGKSTLADRLLEITGTIENRKMRDQVLDRMDLERERGITIKMQPVRMLWHSDRGISQNETQNTAEDFLYPDLSYAIRGVAFEIKKRIGLGHKEQVYQNAFEIEFKKAGLQFQSKKNIPILYEGKSIGLYQPDFVVENKVIVELKALPEIGKPQTEQLWSYLKGCEYKLALLVNFGSKELEIKRIVYDLARQKHSADSAFVQRGSAGVSKQVEVKDLVLNLIDTPGHVDFTYEVSRALAAVEGAILLVDATQGVQAQTIANLHLANRENLTIVPAINKVDLPNADPEGVKKELATLLNIEPDAISAISGKTGEGVAELLNRVVREVPPPKGNPEEPLRALIFDSHFDPYKGIIAYVRIVSGRVQKGARIHMVRTGKSSEILELGTFTPDLKEGVALETGEIGYIATGMKEEGVRVGDTIIRDHDREKKLEALPGYSEPRPVVYASIYPLDADDFPTMKDALDKLKLNDAALHYEPEASEALGRGFRVGFLGMLHLEIITERIRREFNIEMMVSTPSVSYRVNLRSGNEITVYSAADIPDEQEVLHIAEPWVRLEVIAPSEHLGRIMKLLELTRAKYIETQYLSSIRLLIVYRIPLKEVIVDLYDRLKSATSGYASMGYEFEGYERGDLERLDILVAGKRERAFSVVVHKSETYDEGKRIVAKLKELLPMQAFAVPIQAAVGGRIIARETLRAMSKDVTGYLYGGDRTRKMKLWKKQQKGKKRLKERGMGNVEIPPDVFLKMLKR